MRIRPSIVLTAAAAGIVLVSAVPDADRPADRSAGHAVARREVARLAALTAAERDDATAALAGLGDVAVPVLRDALRAPDAEVRDRARAILRTLTATAATVARDRYRESASLLRSAPVADGVPTPGPEGVARLRELAPESGRALADWALRASQRTFVGAPLALELTRCGTDDSLAALAKLWRAERLSPSAALAAARDLDARTESHDNASLNASPLDGDALRDLSRRAMETLGDPLAAREAPRRRAGVALAAAFAGPGAADILQRAARDLDAGVRSEAARALGRHMPGHGAEILRALAADRDADVRVAALEALRRTPGTPRPEPAVAAARDDVAAVRRAAAELFARDATPETLPVLRRLAEDPSPSVRAAARRSLASLDVQAR